MAGVLSSQLSQDFSQTFPAGNLIRSQMKAVEKLSYLEIRFMNLLLDAHEARGKLSQHLDLCLDLPEMKIQAEQICEEFMSARLRFKDHLKVGIAWTQSSWNDVADGSADDCISMTEKTIQELQQLHAQEGEITKWTSWIAEVEAIKEVSWADEIDRLKIEA